MPAQYKYRAVTDDGRPREGVVTAETTQQVVDLLSQQTLTPISITAESGRRPFSLSGLFQKMDYESLILFTNNLITMHRAGIPLLRALSIMRVGPPGSRFNRAIPQIRQDVQSGKLLSQAMEQHKGLFSPAYVASVAAGEESGKLDGILEELAVMLERDMELSRQIKAGVRYPVMVVTAIVGAVIVLISYVVPKFTSFYQAFGAQLPLPTRILIGTSQFFAHYWPLLIAFVVGLFLTFRKVAATEKGKLWIDRKLLGLPVFGNLILKGNVARFCLMFRILFKSGLPIIKSLDILRESVKNSVVSLEIRKLGELFREGRDAALSAREFKYFPEMALQMMAIGLESGSLEKMLFEVGQHYSKEVQYTSRQLTAILEPMLTVVLGAFVLLLALSVFLPMWNLIQVFKGG
ncbi:MAG TPA: type II secretion system F family protein [Candidatus Deferrimicrobium sp.]|nr:type II secretion system F family protein [Candidatus Deferrimicrobium sp.]